MANIKTQEVLEIFKTILPAMQADGGGMTLEKIIEDVVYVRMKGACLNCPSLNLTMKLGIEKTLKKHLQWVKEVKQVSEYKC